MEPNSEIALWMERHGLDAEGAAQALGISRAQAYRHLAGRPLPRRTAFLIEMYDRDPAAMREVAGVASAEEPEPFKGNLADLFASDAFSLEALNRRVKWVPSVVSDTLEAPLGSVGVELEGGQLRLVRDENDDENEPSADDLDVS